MLTHIIAYIIAALIVLAAGFILFRRIRAFRRTGGRSACENCPYHGHCNGKCR